MANCYQGKLLRVNLTTGQITIEVLNQDYAREYIGGRGLGTKLYCEEVGPNVDPLSPANSMYIMPGALTGAGAPSTGRFMVITRGPLTGTIACSNSGGEFGAEIKYAGYDGLIIEGKAAKPVYLWIENDKVEIRPADHIWGKEVPETTDLVRAETDDRAKVACIGPAGENLCKIACIMNEMNRAAGRTGVGAVMGSKNLKAIAIRGNKAVYVPDKERFMAAVAEATQALRTNAVTGTGLPTYGTQILINILDQSNGLPVRNFRDSGTVEWADKTSGEYMIEHKNLVRNKGCFSCVIQCGRVTRTFKPYAGFGEGPEYEAGWGFGADCGVSDIDAICQANFRCNELGLDAISMPTTIACAMELYESGYLPKADAGCDLSFGNAAILKELVEKTAYRQGIGNLLAEGSYRLAEHYGHPELSMSVKKQEMPAYEPRTLQGIGLNYATSNRGGCHVRGYMTSPEILGIPEKLDPAVIEGKPAVCKTFQDLTAAVDASGFCLFTTFGIGAEIIANVLSAATGIDYTPAELLKCGERIWNLERLFNLACGFTAKDDTLPPRILKEPQKYGAYKGKVHRLPEMLPEYYQLRGWNKEGIPTKEKLAELNLTEISTQKLVPSGANEAAAGREN